MGATASVIGIFVAAGAFDSTATADIIDSARFGAVASGLRRLGVVMYLTGIAFGLATIIEVLRFQSIVGQVPGDSVGATSDDVGHHGSIPPLG